MNRREIAELACKVLGLWMFAQSTLYAGMLIAMAIVTAVGFVNGEWPRGVEFIPLGTGLSAALPMLGVGLLFWFRADRIARRMVSGDPTVVTLPHLRQSDALVVACIAIGVSTLVPVLQNLTRIWVTIAQDRYSFDQYWSDASWKADLISSAVGLVLSVWLILGPRGVVNVVLRARRADVPIGGDMPREETTAGEDHAPGEPR